MKEVIDLKDKIKTLFGCSNIIFHIRNEDEAERLDKLYSELYNKRNQDLFKQWYKPEQDSYISCEYLYTKDWSNAYGIYYKENYIIITFDNLLDYVK